MYLNLAAARRCTHAEHYRHERLFQKNWTNIVEETDIEMEQKDKLSIFVFPR